ncbi:DUF3329 domain-containing protein [Roseibium algae]|uniref:DUF3329 domain-containing protein n=1 Tax=Roseibium algae TaxID=3123038 RepID=A0ABU8TKD8_9HYPH
MISDSDHPFFRPLWRRIAIVVFCACWAAFEFYNGNETWGWITLAIAAYAVWTFLIDFKQPKDASASETPAPESEDKT